MNSKKKTTKQDFSWIDQIHEVRDRSVREELDRQLVQKIRRAELESTWLAVPELLDWSRVKSFKYRDAASAEEYSDLHLRQFLEQVRAPEALDVARLKRSYVCAISNETDQAFERWPLYRCLYAELALGGEQFVLTNAKWYRVARDFLSVVDETIGRIPEPAIVLQPYSDTSEEAYNRRMASELQFTLMDRNVITYPGGANKVELCDLYTTGKEFIHIKRYGGSGPLSHLFAQGTVSAELFLQEPEFRRRASEILPPGYRWANPLDRPEPTEYTVIFGIISNSARPLRLPFFSKVTLRNAYRRLSALGYKVCLAKIPSLLPTQPEAEIEAQPTPGSISIARQEERPDSLGA
jgi:uncharacterized protein (TIGR04141 family)